MISKKKRSIRQETRLARKTNSQKVPASGAVRFGGYDLNHKEFCIESKATDKEFYLLKYKELDRIRQISGKKNKCPLFVIEFPSRIYALEYKAVVPADSTILKIITKTFKLYDETLYKEMANKRIYIHWEDEDGRANIWKISYLEELKLKEGK
jgi:hypothetical protein